MNKSDRIDEKKKNVFINYIKQLYIFHIKYILKTRNENELFYRLKCAKSFDDKS